MVGGIDTTNLFGSVTPSGCWPGVEAIAFNSNSIGTNLGFVDGCLVFSFPRKWIFHLLKMPGLIFSFLQ